MTMCQAWKVEDEQYRLAFVLLKLMVYESLIRKCGFDTDIITSLHVYKEKPPFFQRQLLLRE